MEKRRKTNNLFIVIGMIILLIGISLISYDYFSKKKIEIEEEKAIEEFYTTQETLEIESTKENTQIKKEVKKQSKTNYIAILKIPKIDLERGLVDPKSYLNNVKYNIEIVKGSSMPNVRNSNLILASHSGTARISYFKNLNKININDDVYLIYQDKTYRYKVSNKYEIEKTGTAKIIRDRSKTTITLITCKYKTNKQIVIIAELQE